MKATKKQAGSKGGRSTLARHGREHMSEIGRRGAAATWQRYFLAPVEIANYAMVERETGKIIAIW